MSQSTDGSLPPERDTYEALVVDSREQLEKIYQDMQNILERLDRLKLSLQEKEDDRDQPFTTRTRVVNGVQFCTSCGTRAGECGCYVWTRRTC
jgi:hypothetical protein